MKKYDVNVSVVHVSLQMYVLQTKIRALLCFWQTGKAHRGRVLELHVPAKVAGFPSVGQTGGALGTQCISWGTNNTESACACKT